MPSTIEYYFTSISPFSYLGQPALVEMAKRNGVKIDYKPVNLRDIWEVSGAVPPAQRPPVRQRYRMIELQRVADYRNLDIVLKPDHFPTDPSLADHCIIGIVESGQDASGFAAAVGAALWADNQNISDQNILLGLLEKNGLDAEAIMTLANEPHIVKLREENTKRAIELDVVGAPAYAFKGEVFWGQDRIEYLESMIKSDRSPFSS